MTAQVPSPSPAPQRASNRATVNGNRPSGGAIICNGCRNWWTGLGAAHCSSCQRTLPRPGNGPLGEELRTPARPGRQTMGGLVPARHLERTRRMTVSAETRAYWQELGGYYRTQRHRSHPPGQATDCRRGVRRQCDLRREHHLADGRQEDRQVPHRLQRRPVPRISA